MKEFEQIDVKALQAMLGSGGVTIVDIRDEASYQEAHIPGAIALNDKNLKEFLADADKEKSVLCYCYHGVSSQSAAQYFVSQGFKRVYSLIGGFEQWSNEQ